MYIKDCIITRFTSNGMYKKKGKISANSLKKPSLQSALCKDSLKFKYVFNFLWDKR